MIPKPNVNVWTVYGANWCPYCMKSIKYLKSRGINFQYVNIEDYMSIGEFKKYFDKKTKGYKSIPMIFYKTKFIGGYTDLVKLL